MRGCSMRSDTRSEPYAESRGSALWTGRASGGSAMLREGQVDFPLPRRDLLIEILAALRSRHSADLCSRAR